jgi:hypothetical protein
MNYVWMKIYIWFSFKFNFRNLKMDMVEFNIFLKKFVAGFKYILSEFKKNVIICLLKKIISLY